MDNIIHEPQVKQIHLGKYQMGDNTIETSPSGLVCDCAFQGDCTHVKKTLESLKKADFGLGFTIMERSKLKQCKFCNSNKIKKVGFRKTKQSKVQKFSCMD